MKKTFYCYRDNKFDPPPNDNEYCNMDNEKRKLLSIETNRRRRDMAIRVRKQIEKEEERRREVLRERREYHENMTNKMRKIRSTKGSRLQSQNMSKPWDLDQTLTLIRNHSSNPTINSAHNHDHSNSNYKTILEGAWNDFREGGSSPMAKYSGVNSNSRPRTSNFYLKTFETKLMAQEQSLKEKQNSQMSEFIKILDDTVEGIDKFDEDNNNNSTHQYTTQNSTFRVEESYINSHKERNGDLKSEMKVEEILEDSLDESNDESMEVENHCKIDIPLELKKVEIPISVPVQPVSKNCIQLPIKSILKKDLHSHFNSNPDISGIVPRDSVEITRINSAKLKRCSSFSQYINYSNHETSSDERSYVEEDSGRKIVRFADSPSLTKTRGLSSDTISSDKIMQCEMFQENVRNPINPKSPKQPTVPNSTPLKPPLHPRTVQEGSYVHATLKKQAIFHPPVKPRKISTETLDREISCLMNQKSTNRNHFCSSNIPDSGQSRENHIPLDRTPTEKEIDQLWAEVRECLSRSQYPSKTGSVGTPAGLSVRTIDSGSESSVRSAPTWQRSAKKMTSFQVRHHAPLTQKQNVYQGQGPPVKDFVIVHAPHEQYIHSEVIHQPLSVLTPEVQKFQQVSESLEEFLATENACRISQSARNVFPPHSPLNRPKIGQHLNCKVIVPSPSLSNPNTQIPSNVQRTQISMDEEKIKMSLDKLNERLKNIYM